jgi:hypothetical protein
MATALVVPERSLAQRRDALARANEIRSYRAALKADVKAGRKRVTAALLVNDPMLDSMRVYELLLAQPKVGRVRVNRILNRIGISPSKTVGGLSERQRGELALYLR